MDKSGLILCWMKLLLRTLLLVFFCIFLAVFTLVLSKWHASESNLAETFHGSDTLDLSPASQSESTSNRVTTDIPGVTLVLVACGDRLNQVLTCIKSALIFSRSPLKVYIFAENELKDSLEQQLTKWQSLFTQKWSFEIRALEFPAESEKEWKTLFKPCAAQRLFLPGVMQEVDSIIYVDVDTLFLSPIDTLWKHFHSMNASQMAALVPESEDPATGWYNRFARHPYYGNLGVNSGVMLMNLTKFRKFQWNSYIVPTYQHYKLNITWGDQDIINIIFHYHPDKLYLLPCEFNYRPDHCMYMSVCKSAEVNGVHVLHGNRGAFVSEKQPAFKAFFEAFSEFIPGQDLLKNLIQPLEAKLEEAPTSNCGRVSNHLLKNLVHSLV